MIASKDTDIAISSQVHRPHGCDTAQPPNVLRLLHVPIEK